MWTCKQCSEEIEDSFEVCWKCGATIDGEVDPEFQVLEDDDAFSDHGDAAPADSDSDTDTESESENEVEVSGENEHRQMGIFGFWLALFPFIGILLFLLIYLASPRSFREMGELVKLGLLVLFPVSSVGAIALGAWARVGGGSGWGVAAFWLGVIGAIVWGLAAAGLGGLG